MQNHGIVNNGKNIKNIKLLHLCILILHFFLDYRQNIYLSMLGGFFLNSILVQT